MTESYFLAIERFEGQFDTSQTNIYISIDENKVGECSLDKLPANFLIPLPGIITLSIYDKNTQAKQSNLTFHSNLVSPDWYYWFPISLSVEASLSSLPLNALQPRLLLSILKKFSHLTLESSDTQASTKHKSDLSKEFIQSSDPESINTNSNEFYINADNERLIQYYQKLVQNLESQIQNQKASFENHIENLKSQIFDLQHELNQEKRCRINLETKLDTLNPDELQQNFMNSSLNLNKSHKVKLQKSIIINTQKGNSSQNYSFSLNNDSEILEKKVNEILIRLKLVGLLKKAKETNFIIGAKTIALCYRKGEVMCKNGVSLESYIFKHCSIEIENFLRARSGITMKKNASSHSPLSFRKVRMLDTQ